MEDFTEENYRKYLQMIKCKTIFYEEAKKHEAFTLWRHDVDFSVHIEYALSKIEYIWY